MQISNNYSYKLNIKTTDRNNFSKPGYNNDLFIIQAQDTSLSFKANPITALKDYLKYKRAQQIVIASAKEVNVNPSGNKFLFRNLSMEFIEGLQYGIDVFKGLSMKDIQYLSENLHVIAVKRGCNNMCGYCYADAKPSNREMSWEDFTSITNGFKKLRERLCGFQLFGENMHPQDSGLIYKTTELFYDADCMSLAIKDKKGKIHDYRDLVSELYEGLGRRSAFDTSGWIPENTLMQKRAEDYVEYFSKPENMEKLNEFNLSFNVFSASNVAAVKALRAGDIDRYNRLREKFTDKIANVIFTFTPLLKEDKFNIMQRAFGPNAKNAEGFDLASMCELTDKVINKVTQLYQQDLSGERKYISSNEDMEEKLKLLKSKLSKISTALNSSGRMKEFMASFGIKAPMQDHTESTQIMFKDLQERGRFHRYIAHKLIDADGRVYHMDYARFFPTDIQLNLSNKTPAPPLANLREDCAVTREIINRAETR